MTALAIIVAGALAFGLVWAALWGMQVLPSPLGAWRHWERERIARRAAEAEWVCARCSHEHGVRCVPPKEADDPPVFEVVASMCQACGARRPSFRTMRWEAEERRRKSEASEQPLRATGDPLVDWALEGRE